MNTVFIGGSRSISRLNKTITHVLDKIAEKGLRVIVGDANGADKAIQRYFININYQNVLVYCMENQCRNNLGSWETINVATNVKDRSYKYYFVKDLRMANDSQFGFMLWDSKSKGTLNNIINLLKENKQTVVYFSPTREVPTLNNLNDLDNLLNKCDQETLTKLDSILNIKEKRLQHALFPAVNETQIPFNI